ncbi:MAG: hypothetical protein PW843_10545 [Azospirillaceae bacterium]|nr:hypothetical protein [Azospirillaceae bacterium]
MTKFQVTENPDEYPFALTDREFDYYATKNFGGKIPDVQGIYKPPSFYTALAQDVGVIIMGTAVGVFLPALIPEAAGAAALGAPAFATAASRAVVSSAITSAAGHLLPGNAWDAARQGRLWPRYCTEFSRRLLR